MGRYINQRVGARSRSNPNSVKGGSVESFMVVRVPKGRSRQCQVRLARAVGYSRQRGVRSLDRSWWQSHHRAIVRLYSSRGFPPCVMRGTPPSPNANRWPGPLLVAPRRR
jgi:hypothetical protein